MDEPFFRVTRQRFDADLARNLIGLDVADFVLRLTVGPVLTALGASEPFLTVGIGLSLSIIGGFIVVIARIMVLATNNDGTTPRRSRQQG